MLRVLDTSELHGAYEPLLAVQDDFDVGTGDSFQTPAGRRRRATGSTPAPSASTRRAGWIQPRASRGHRVSLAQRDHRISADFFGHEHDDSGRWLKLRETLHVNASMAVVAASLAIPQGGGG